MVIEYAGGELFNYIVEKGKVYIAQCVPCLPFTTCHVLIIMLHFSSNRWGRMMQDVSFSRSFALSNTATVTKLSIGTVPNALKLLYSASRKKKY
jgi:hypothetical protein